MSKKLKIFFIAPCLSMGGMERASVTTANGLEKLGCQVTFLSLFKKDHFFSLNNSITLLEPDNFNQSSLSLRKSVLWIRKEVQDKRPDVVLVFNKFYGAITAIATSWLEVPLFVSERSSPHFKWKKYIAVFNKFAYSLKPPKGIIAQTGTAASFQLKYFNKSEVTVIPNSVKEVKLFPEVKREKIILAVGRLNDHLKGFDLLLEAFALMNNQEWELHIAGDDKNAKDLKQQARELGVKGRIKFLGQIKDIDCVYARSGIFVIPSRSEGFPNALIEAMAAGLPCISFNFIAGPAEIIDSDVNGIVIEFGDVQAMACAIDNLINDSEKRMYLSKNAMKIREQLKCDKISKKYLEFISNNS